MVFPEVDVEYHGVELYGQLTDELYDWLNKMCPGRFWIKMNRDGPVIYFRNERDHMMFLLAWGK
jgi:hypothetical protein